MAENYEKVKAFIEDNVTIKKAYEKGGSFTRDLNIVLEELENMESGDAVNYARLANIIYVSFHKDGKIEGLQSIDSSATGCSYCERMRAAAKNDSSVICGYCYDYKQEHRFKAHSILPRHWLNMTILSCFDFPIEFLAGLKLTTFAVRVNSSGDIENIIHAENIVKIAIAHKRITFVIWSKNAFALAAAFEKYGKPENVIYIQSSVRINKESRPVKFADHVFTVYTKENIDAALSAGANECNGKKCADCGYKCYLRESAGGWKTGSNTAELLR